jgi:hypothetical protein
MTCPIGDCEGNAYDWKDVHTWRGYIEGTYTEMKSCKMCGKLLEERMIREDE